ncbi:hypothetical protein HMI56_006874 [Coelomomyces lativittatus]|nr:hypothetical protein HMI56_006874 [Coelomomyces lativittatus]
MWASMVCGKECKLPKDGGQRLATFEEVHVMGSLLHWDLQFVKKFQGLSLDQMELVFGRTSIPQGVKDELMLIELRGEFFNSFNLNRIGNVPNPDFASAMEKLLKFRDDEISFILETCHEYSLVEALEHIIACL